MITLTVILSICLLFIQDTTYGFRMYKYARSVDTSQFTPQSPCPTVFQYQNDENGNLIGAIKVSRADQDGKVQLDVELSVGNSVQGYNGKITLAEDRQKVINDIMNGKSIFYRVHFPAWQNIPPKITKIQVNGDQICSGPRIPIQMVPVLTTINLQHKLSLGVTPLISSSDPTVDSSSLESSSTFGSQGYYGNARPFTGNSRQFPYSQGPSIDLNKNVFLNGRVSGVYNSGRSNIASFNQNGLQNVQVPGLDGWILHVLDLDGQVNSQGGSQNQQTNTQYPFDIRVDNLPAIPNNIFTDNFNSGGHQETSSNPFLNVNNPYNFNPPTRSPPDRHPSPDGRPAPPNDRPSTNGNVFPENPFLVGLSTPQTASDAQNSFFDTRTTEASPVILPSTTKPPSRIGTSNYNEICGRPIATNSLIVNGQTVPRGAYPWLVAIFRQLENLSLSYICSGSLISDRHVVTAAHCVKLEYRRVKPSEIVCVFGKLNIRKWVTAPEERMLEPDSIIVHPDYVTGKANADIAIMTFQDPIPFNKMIRPVCLWQGSNDLTQVVGQIGTVVGWGRDENGDVSTAEPRQVNMPIVDQLECLKGSSSSVGQALVEIVSKNTFCAGFRNGSGPCNGDSGSAFLLRKDDVFYLRGIVSTALSEVTHKSCNLQEYVVFADATKYLDWLLDILKQK